MRIDTVYTRNDTIQDTISCRIYYDSKYNTIIPGAIHKYKIHNNTRYKTMQDTKRYMTQYDFKYNTTIPSKIRYKTQNDTKYDKVNDAIPETILF